MMSINSLPLAQVSQGTRKDLASKLAGYYASSPTAYYEQADSAAENYRQGSQPFHCDLIQRIRQGQSILEVGCGSAHLCPFVEGAGGSYTGMDHGEDLLAHNRRRFPKARFRSLGSELPEVFDVVASLYTIEHVVDPLGYLESLWNFCRPGGLIAIICPDFVDGAGYPPSFYYGATARRLRAKLTTLSLTDAAQHLLDLYWFAPRWKRRARAAEAGAFWINLSPRLFAKAEYSVDADAVHLPRLHDLTWWLRARGAEIVETSHSLPGVEEHVLRHNCYVLARKPGLHTFP